MEKREIKLISMELLIALIFLSLTACSTDMPIRYGDGQPVFRGKPSEHRIPLNIGLYISDDFEFFRIKKWKWISRWHYNKLGWNSARQFELELNNIFRKMEVIREKPPFMKDIWKKKAKGLNAIIEPKIEEFYFDIPIWPTSTFPARIRYEIVLSDMEGNMIFRRTVEGIGDVKGRFDIRGKEWNARAASAKAIEEGVSRAVQAILDSEELKAFLKTFPR